MEDFLGRASEAGYPGFQFRIRGPISNNFAAISLTLIVQSKEQFLLSCLLSLLGVVALKSTPDLPSFSLYSIDSSSVTSLSADELRVVPDIGGFTAIQSLSLSSLDPR